MNKIFVPVIFAFIGWAFCAAIMGIGPTITSMRNTLIVHAIGGPLGFSLLAYIYHKKFGHLSPLATATIFIAFALHAPPHNASQFFFIACYPVSVQSNMFFYSVFDRRTRCLVPGLVHVSLGNRGSFRFQFYNGLPSNLFILAASGVSSDGMNNFSSILSSRNLTV